MKDYYLYYTENIPIAYEGYNSSLYKEDQGYLWRATGFGGDPSYDYDEVIKVTNISNNRIVFKLKHQLLPEFFASQGYEYKDLLSCAVNSITAKCQQFKTADFVQERINC